MFTTLQQLMDAERRRDESDFDTLDRLVADGRSRLLRIPKRNLMDPSPGRIWAPPVGQPGGGWQISEAVVEELLSYATDGLLPSE